MSFLVNLCGWEAMKWPSSLARWLALSTIHLVRSRSDGELARVGTRPQLGLMKPVPAVVVKGNH
jgi:hypothetical protein